MISLFRFIEKWAEKAIIKRQMQRGYYKITSLPGSYPVDLAYVKEHSKIPYTDEDTVLLGYLKAAIDYAERYTNRALMTQTITQKVDCFPAVDQQNPFGEIRLFRSPVVSVTHVKYYDTENAEQTLVQNTDYVLSNYKEPASVALLPDKHWPSTARRPQAVEVEYISGYADASFVPDTIKQAIVLLFGSYETKREDWAKRYKSAAETLLDLTLVDGW